MEQANKKLNKSNNKAKKKLAKVTKKATQKLSKRKHNDLSKAATSPKYRVAQE